MELSERIDHAKEAQRLISAIDTKDWNEPSAYIDRRTAASQVHATLAIAEQLRVANLIALAHVADTSDAAVTPLEQDAWNALGVQGSGEMRPEIREVLGLE